MTDDYNEIAMAEKPNYVKEAAKEPMNIWGMVGFVAASVFAATQGGVIEHFAWIPLAVGAASEGLYLVEFGQVLSASTAKNNGSPASGLAGGH